MTLGWLYTRNSAHRRSVSPYFTARLLSPHCVVFPFGCLSANKMSQAFSSNNVEVLCVVRICCKEKQSEEIMTWRPLVDYFQDLYRLWYVVPQPAIRIITTLEPGRCKCASRTEEPQYYSESDIKYCCWKLASVKIASYSLLIYHMFGYWGVVLLYNVFL